MDIISGPEAAYEHCRLYMPNCDTPLPASSFDSEEDKDFQGGYLSKNTDQTIIIEGGDDDPQYGGYEFYSNTTVGLRKLYFIKFICF